MRPLRVLVCAVLAIGLAACGSAEPAASPSAPFRTVEHVMGKTVIPEQPKRVVALDQSFVDAVLTLETPVVGYTTYRSIDTELPGYLGAVAERHGKEAAPVGTLEQPSLEKIIVLKPDLIVSAKVRHEALYEKLSKIAPTVFSETTGAIWKDNLRLMGRALGKETLADTRIKEYEKRAATIGASIKGKEGELPTISIVRFAGEPTTRLYVENSYSGVVMKDVGFPRPQDQPNAQDAIAVDVSQERIAELDADQIFVATYPDPSSDEPKEKFVNNPLWGKLKGDKHEVSDLTWMSAVGIQGAHAMLDDVAKFFAVDPARSAS
ncbi:iron-siderophore ABC transporter substrate-binding protein [Nonomuraea sp. KC401]|uniref:ABC transporter substrate-binding protein n=1 Tax=unclassified Nonomuraea TaxID=2593643 RepID=UPI0010FDE3CF|nr:MULTISPECIES: iron-siderophore ABC transporter substrate-binding protein [unclassified Nonomuraea]NBE99104.1 ABC transporter substrate-binding protein [Nonomuraea sp. K271]TLF58153.1 iron-siderophore ABC transporter substrate-binding protein [Nonomuraea sp. KC401]